VSRVIEGAKDETDAVRRLKADGDTFKRPLIVDWNQGKAGKCCASHFALRRRANV
jgi:hypothetical protein